MSTPLSAALRYLHRHHVGLLALMIALGGTTYAASKVGPGDISRNAVKAKQIAPNAVQGSEAKDASLGGADLGDGSVGAADLADGAAGGTEIANGAVGGSKIADGAVGSTKIADGAVTGAKIGAGAVGREALRCPAGMIREDDLCWDSADRPAATWIAAHAQCSVLGLELPNLSQLISFLGGLPAPAAITDYWANDLTGTGLAARAAKQTGGSVNFAEEATSDSNVSRCVTTLG